MIFFSKHQNSCRFNRQIWYFTCASRYQPDNISWILRTKTFLEKWHLYFKSINNIRKIIKLWFIFQRKIIILNISKLFFFLFQCQHQLESPLRLSLFHLPIQISSRYLGGDRKVKITGWSSSHGVTRYLTSLGVIILNQRDCGTIFRKYGFVHSSQACAEVESKDGAVTWVKWKLFNYIFQSVIYFLLYFSKYQLYIFF